MLNKSKGEYAYNIIDIDNDIDDTTISQIKTVKEISTKKFMDFNLIIIVFGP